VTLYWIGLAEERKSWRAVVNAVMKLGVPKYAGNLLTPEEISASQEGSCRMELVN
jgi:hypothetical protein